MKTLNISEVGKNYKVAKINGNGALRRRIMDMGVTKGVLIKICKTAPFGDPLEITVRGFQLTVRKKEAELIEVEEA